jgi:hypothetical protein
VLLSRALSVSAESVQEIYAAMDSVFVGDAERQVARFLDKEDNPVLVGELLSWVTEFTTEEAPNLVHSGGRKGVEAMSDTLKTLIPLVQQFLHAIAERNSLLPEALRHPRVINPCQELQSYLERTQEIVEEVLRP